MAVEKKKITQIYGRTGLNRYGGHVYEELHPKLRGTQAIKIYQEMRDNDAVVGAFLFLIKMLVRQSTWTEKAASEDEVDADAAQFLAECRADMSHTWGDLISEVLSMLWAGWSYFEIVYKRRGGPDGPPESRSAHTDNKIGWRKIEIRAQETLSDWEFDPDDGSVIGMWQSAPPTFERVFIPIEKALLFRTETTKGNPEGRALDPDTLLPTPDGWKRLDNIHPGDKVFDETGKIRYVVARQDWDDRPCYKLHFGDGCEIVADANHIWVTANQHERSRRKPPIHRTTEEIVNSLKISSGATNHGIEWAGALDYPTQHLVIPPYVLGLWLGDGDSNGARISTHVDDAEEEATYIRQCGYEARVEQNGIEGCNGRSIKVSGTQLWATDGLQHQLRVIGLIKNKHIPETYLRGNIEQRKALLAGLMDSDGTVDSWGRCEFCNTNKDLASGVAELVRSLGVAASMRIGHKANGIDHKLDAWSVKFTPPWSPFKLKRKTERTINKRGRVHHYIVAAESVHPRRTVCIEVDSPSHMFLAGTSMIPTHNSILRNAYRSWFFVKRFQELEAIGMERDLAGLPVMEVPPHIMTADVGSADASLRAEFETMISEIKRDEREGLVIPAEEYTGDDGQIVKTGYKFRLQTSGGQRQIDTDARIKRYETRIAMSVLAEFMFLGTDKVGSFALSSDKTELFGLAISAWLDMIASIFNRFAIPRLFALNGMKLEKLPVLVPGPIEKPALEAVGNYVANLAKAGIITPDPVLETEMRRMANLPEPEQAEVL